MYTVSPYCGQICLLKLYLMFRDIRLITLSRDKVILGGGGEEKINACLLFVT